MKTKLHLGTKAVFGIAILGAILAVAGVVVLLLPSPYAPGTESGTGGGILPGTGTQPAAAARPTVVAFKSLEEFKEYLAKAEAISGRGYGLIKMNAVREGLMAAPAPAVAGGQGAAVDESATRYSETNVQVTGIDEPDIVKNDGRNIYLSSRRSRPVPLGSPVPLPAREGGILAPSSYPAYRMGEIKLMRAFPPTDLKEQGRIDQQGDLLLHNNTLVVFPTGGYYYDGGQSQAIYGFDVSNISSSTEKWKVELGKKSSFVTARLHNGKIYAVTVTGAQLSDPCPIIPLRAQGKDVIVPCTGIYHPVVPAPVDVTYTASIINPATGGVEKTVSFVGSTGSSVIYMSPNALYVTYRYQADLFGFLVDFFSEKGQGLLPQDILSRLLKIKNYDLSDQTKLQELSVILERYYGFLDGDERQRIENEFTNKMKDYTALHVRELERTGIIKIDLGELAVRASGAVPGTLLNQFSLDEYEGYLRVATTISGQMGFYFGFGGGSSESANDVYVLDGSLDITGFITGLGLTERIYSVRFIEDKGYVVTFRQTDPFYVLDLSDPKHPERKGELKIPGFSSYLDPIAKNRILGIGREGSNVKLSLFDVASAENPKEISKYTMSEYWSEIQNTHHAFLADREKEIFFLPGSRGGYVFLYKNDALELLRVVSDIQARRALYINDYLYIVGENEIAVLDERDWSKVKELELE